MYAVWHCFTACPKITSFVDKNMRVALRLFITSHPDIERELLRRGHLGNSVVEFLPIFQESRLNRLQASMVKESLPEALERLGEMNALGSDEMYLLSAAYKRYVVVYETHVLANKVATTSAHVREYIQATNGCATMQKFPEIIACVCAVWTLLTSQSFRNKSLMTPHIVQILAVFRLLGVDRAQDKPEADFSTAEIPSHLLRHLLQINTGEGKSLVVAVTAAVFALCGIHADCTCYSSYLSKRDFYQFEPLFCALKVRKFIKYATLTQLCNDNLRKEIDIRKVTQQLLQKNSDAGSFPVTRGSRPRVLLVDEVDVFCSEHFYGAMYQPCQLLRSATITQLFERMWSLHKQGLLSTEESKTAFLKTDEVTRLYSEMPQPFVKAALQVAMGCLGMIAFHDYRVVDGKIAYPQLDGTFDSNSCWSYLTYWVGCKEFDAGHMPRPEAYLLGVCGLFSYERILEEYDTYGWIGGASGTLMDLSLLETALLEQYRIQHKTVVPTFFADKKQPFNPLTDVMLADSDAAWSDLIAHEIEMAQQAPRPVIVYFEQQEDLNRFRGSARGTEFSKRAHLLIYGSCVDSLLEIYDDTILLCLKEFGRGLDFVCPNTAVEAAGGCHVVLTFLTQKSEEVQIFGRTARQAKRGSARLVLNGSRPPVSVMTPLCRGVTSGDTYLLVNCLRSKLADELFQKRQIQLRDTKRLHCETMQFVHACRAWLKGPDRQYHGQHYDDALAYLVQQAAKPPIS
jgi:hypothetical protein